jgi:hypothetical protein
VLVGDRVYQTNEDGELFGVDAKTGTILWHKKLAADQVHASPVWGDGKLYVPMNNGTFWIIRPKPGGDGAREEPEVLAQLQLEGNCLGAPAIWNGKVWVHTTAKLYCFGTAGGKAERRGPAKLAPEASAKPGAAVRLQVIPADFLARPGDAVSFRVRSLDAKGAIVDPDVKNVTWGDAGLGLAISASADLTIAADGKLGVGVISAEAGGLKGSVRARIVPVLPIHEDFDGLPLTQPDPERPGENIGWPPSYWIGGRPKWDVREVDGERVAAKTLDNPLFQRVTSTFGHPDSSNYTVQVDIKTDGSRRSLSSAGVVNQRYLILLKGNHQALEVSSNVERIKEDVPYAWKAGAWQRLKSRVDMGEDGSATVRAKVWPRDEPEPEAWMIEVVDPYGHDHGAPGVFGFSPQSRYRVYIDNLQVIPNE